MNAAPAPAPAAETVAELTAGIAALSAHLELPDHNAPGRPGWQQRNATLLAYIEATYATRLRVALAREATA